MSNPTFLAVEHLIKTYGNTTAVNDVSFYIEEGESVALVGESGCGKSTMARVIVGLEKPTEGQILFRGQPYTLQRKGRNSRGASAINMVFQDPIDSFDSRMTVFSSLYEALSHTRKISRANAVQVIEDALTMVELPTHYMKRKVSQLSGGECQRIGIARALLTEPQLLICDECTSALDVSVQAQIIHLLSRLKQEKECTYLFISHDLGLVSCMCNRVLVMYKGVLVEEGDVTEVMEHSQHPYTRLLVSCGEAFILDTSGNAGHMPAVPAEDAPGSTVEGCVFSPFCAQKSTLCDQRQPTLEPCGANHRVACHNYSPA